MDGFFGMGLKDENIVWEYVLGEKLLEGFFCGGVFE